MRIPTTVFSSDSNIFKKGMEAAAFPFIVNTIFEQQAVKYPSKVNI